MPFALLAVLAAAAGAPLRAEPPAVSTAPVRLGYFHGGRTNLLYRAFTHGCFDAAGVGVELYSKAEIREKGFEKVPRDAWYEGETVGKATGVQIVDRVARGEFDGGAIGEASFLDAVARGEPVVAVALLGHQSTDKPGHAILLRSGVAIRSPADFRGKTLISRRAGPMDAALLREFVLKLGLDPDKDVKILPQVYEDEAESLLKEGKADGGLFHLLTAKDLIERKIAYIYRPMDWADPQMMQALLVFNRDFLKRSPDKVQRIVDAYVDRIAYERALPDAEKDRSGVKGLMMAEDYQGLSIPTFDPVPKVRPEVLLESERLLVKHGALKRTLDLGPFIDNGFVERAAARPVPAAPAACLAHPRLPFQNVVVLGWDGTRRERVRALLAQGRLPNLARFVAGGKWLDMDVTSGETATKAGWAQILTGYAPETTGVFNNRRRYRAIPEGYTVPERLKARFGDGITTVFLAGKLANLGARGPHKVCVNCERGLWWDEKLFAGGSRVPRSRREILSMDSEPYMETKKHVDEFAVGLGAMDRVGGRILEALDAQNEKRFFLFAEFEEPDEMGHVYGEGSPQYSDALVRLDAWLGRILQRLKEHQLAEQTLVYLVSDHSFGEGRRDHMREPRTILVTNDPAVARGKADRLDVAPTLLDRYGFDLKAVTPPLAGRSLLEED